MTTLVTDNLPLVSGAANGIAKLRELIQELAVRGKLVSQDDGDEPADLLLGRIASERALRAKLAKPIASLLKIEHRHGIPRGWSWTRLASQVLESGAGWSPSCEPRPRKGAEWGVLKVSAVSWATYKPDANKALPANVQPRPEHEVKPSDFLVSRANTAELVARSVVVDSTPPRLMLSDKIVRLKLTQLCNRRFINLANSCPDARRYYSTVAGGTSSSMKNVSREQILNLPVPLPPLAEQQRIVAKVDELMALCDRLEAEQADAEAAHAQLVQALLASLTQARDPADFRASWQQLSEHFHTLFNTEASVEALRQSVLELGVMGRLTSFGRDAEWPQVKLGSVAKLINGDRGSNYPNRSEYVPEGIPFINTGHINPDGSLDLESMHFLTRQKFDSLRSGKIEPDDLVYCLRGATLGKTAFVRPFAEGAIASSLVILRFAEVVLPEFAYYFLVSPSGRRWIWKFDNGSAQPNLAASSVREYEMPLPSLEEQETVVSRITELLTLCDQLKLNLGQARQQHEHLASVLVEQVVA